MAALNTNDYGYVIPPTAQFKDENGLPYSAGFVEFYTHGTSEQYTTYADWAGSLNPFRIRLNSQGKAVAIIPKGVVLDMYVYNYLGNLAFTRLNVTTGGEGGEGSNLQFTSSDGSVVIERTNDVVDLTVKRDDTTHGIIVGTTTDQNSAIVFSNVVDGDIEVTQGGKLKVESGKLYHVTVAMQFATSVLHTNYASCIISDSEGGAHDFTLDESIPYNEVEVSWDMTARSEFIQLALSVPNYVTLSKAKAFVHSVNPLVGGGGGGGSSVQADWTETDPSAPDYIKNKPEIPTKTSDLQNDSGFITESDIPAQEQANWNETDQSDPSYIQNKPSIPTKTSDLQNDSGFITSSDIPAQEQSNWNENDSSDPSYIQNKPDLSVYAEKSDLATVATTGDYDDLSNKPTIPAAQVNSDWNSSSGVSEILNKPDLSIYAEKSELAAVATTGDYDDLSNKPNIPAAQVQSDWNQSDSAAVDYIKNKPSIPAAQVQSDWNQSNSSEVDYIKNKPSVPTKTSDLQNDSGFITSSDIPAQEQANWNETDSSDPSYIQNKPSIPTKTSDLQNDSGFITASDVPAQQQADWNQSDSSAVDYIKNKPQNLVQDADYVHTDNNYTDQDEAKLAGIEAGAEVNVQSDWNQANSSADDYIKNKPQNLVQDADYVHTDNNYTDQDEAKLAGIEAGAEVNVQSDWSQSDSSADDYIKNKPSIPTKTSDLQNDSGFITSSDVPGAQDQADWNESDSSAPSYIKNKPTIPTVPVQDVQVNGTSVVSNGVASVDVPILAEGSNVHITQNGHTFTIAATDTTYTAGEGIQITNNQISVDADALNIDYWHGGSSSTIAGSNLNTGVSAASYRGTNIYANSGAITLKKGTYAVHAFVKVNNNSVSIDPNLYKFSINGGITGGSPIRTVEFDNSFTHEEVYELTFMTLNTSDTDTALVLTTDALTALAGLNVSLPYIQVYCLNGLVGVSGGGGSGTANVAITSSDHSVTVNETTIGDTSSFDLSVPQQVQSNWNESNQNSKAFIQNKPSIPSKTSDLQNDSGFITASQVPAQVQSDWNQSDSSAVDYIKNKPSIPSAQVQSDWSETVTTDPSYIQNKPEEMTLVAGSNVTITPDAVNRTLTITASSGTQVQSDWAESDSTYPSYIQNKPTSTTLVAGANITLTPDAVNHTLTIAATGGGGGGVTDVTVDGVSVVSQGVAAITMPTDLVPSVTSSDDGKILKATYSGGTGSYSWETAPSVPSSLGDLSITAGITDIQVVSALPAQPVATVLYLIPET